MSRRRKPNSRRRRHDKNNRRCESQTQLPTDLDDPLTIRGVGEALEIAMCLDHEFGHHHAGFVLDHLGYMAGVVILTEPHETIDDVLDTVARELAVHSDPVSFVVLFSSGLEIIDDVDIEAELRFTEFRDRLLPGVELVDWLMSGHDHFRSVASMIDDPSIGWDGSGRLPPRAPRNAA